MRGVVPLMLVALMVLGLPVFLEPDMGTASLLVFTAFGMLFCAGARLEHLVLVGMTLLPPIALAVGASA